MNNIKYKRNFSEKRKEEIKESKIRKREIKTIESSKIGECYSISTSQYAKLQNKYLSQIGLKNDKNIYSQSKVIDDIRSGKKTRPIVVLWSSEYSNWIIASSLTSKPHKGSNYKVGENSYINFNVLTIQKDILRVSFNGKVHNKFSEEEINNFILELKNNRTKTYLLFVEKLSEYRDIAMKEERDFKEELINKLLENAQT